MEHLYDITDGIDLLTFEEFLAEACDMVVIPVESPGTICELGAFTHSEALLNGKMMLIIDQRYKKSNSFIIQGPVKKAENSDASVIFVPLDNGPILNKVLMQELSKKITELSQTRSRINFRNPNSSDKNKGKVFLSSFLQEIIELIELHHRSLFLKP